MAERAGVSRGTVRHAYALLAAEGAIASRQGARRVVLATQRTQSLFELRSFSSWARSIGAEPSGRVISFDWRDATEEERRHLDLAAGEFVLDVVRVRLLDGVPAMVERTAYPPRVGALFTVDDAESGSLTEAIEAGGFTFANAEHTIDAVAASVDDAALLGVDVGSALLRARRRSTDPSGVPLEWSDDRYAGDASFVVHNTAAIDGLSRMRA